MAQATLAAALGKMLDELFEADARLTGFRKLKGGKNAPQRFLREAPATQQQVEFYRDKGWTAQGGTLYWELYCLVPRVQLALTGQAQSLAEPDYAVPFTHFQYGTSEPQPHRQWSLRSAEDLAALKADLESWLPGPALSWFEQFERDEGVHAFLQRQGRHHQLALLCAAAGDKPAAQAHLRDWLNTLPRQIERPVASLVEKGLVTPPRAQELLLSSIQHEDDYRRFVQRWSGGA